MVESSGVRGRNIDSRIDYVLASPGAMPFVKDTGKLPADMGSTIVLLL